MAGGRFDVVVRALTGPLASQGEIRLQGPLVGLGMKPGPGGLAIPVRGLDSLHARIRIDADGTAYIVPVGTNQVRTGPHAQVDWRQIDPLQGPAYINAGGAVHLGPVGRGCTLEITRIEALGQWTGGAVGSTAADVSSKVVTGDSKQAPRTARRISPAALGLTTVGCLFVATAVCSAALVIGVIDWRPSFEPLPPIEEGEEYYLGVQVEGSKVVENRTAMEGLQGGWERFVVTPSADIAEAEGRDMESRRQPENWDRRAFDHFAASFEAHASARAFYKRLDAVKEEYATVVSALRRADLPEALAAIPYTESRYRPRTQSPYCAEGWWQFMPEVGHRMGLTIKDCAIDRVTGDRVTWSPTGDVAPPRKKAPYFDLSGPNTQCAIAECRVDERTDLERSTDAAVRSLGEPLADRDIRESGAAVTLAILSHNVGYDDSRFGIKRSGNVRPAYLAWRKGQPEDVWHTFYGSNITCPHDLKGDDAVNKRCGGKLPAQGQRYAYTVIAQHVLATCFYGKYYADQFPVFQDWERGATAEGGWCRDVVAPPRPDSLH